MRLLEDVTAGGMLVTYPNTSKEVNDSGLRFIPAGCGDRGGVVGAGL